MVNDLIALVHRRMLDYQCIEANLSKIETDISTDTDIAELSKLALKGDVNGVKAFIRGARNLDDMPVCELQKLAKKLFVHNWSRVTKMELIEAIRNAQNRNNHSHK